MMTFNLCFSGFKPSHSGYILPLAVCAAVLFAAAVLLFYKWKTRREFEGEQRLKYISVFM